MLTYRCLFPLLLIGFGWLVAPLPGLAQETKAAPPVNDAAVAPVSWPAWRGPTGNGIAQGDQLPPVSWSAEENIVWMREIPGKGHGSPIIWEDNVLLATAEVESQTQSLICLDRKTGATKWSCPVHRNGVEVKGNKKASLASSTPACDGERIYINFLNSDAVYTSAISLSGELLWQTKISDYTVHQGYGSSPRIYGERVIVSADNKGGGAIAALDRSTGEVVWRVERPELPNYVSPVIVHVGGRDQLVFSGCDLVTSLDPSTGEKLWEIPGATTECVTTSVTDGQRIFTSGGYPRNHVAAVRADGSGTIDWENNVRVYVPSMILSEGHLYAVADAGIALCWDSATGEEKWKERLGGTFSGSPVMVGSRVYATNEEGETYVFEVSPTKFELLATNKLGSESYSSPAIAGGQVVLRFAQYDGDHRQEIVACIGH